VWGTYIIWFFFFSSTNKIDSATHRCLMLERVRKKGRAILLDPYCFINLR
jgi:hypothetical protein